LASFGKIDAVYGLTGKPLPEAAGNSEKTVRKRDMANPQNLKPWPKGTSGNPAGRPRRDKLTAALLDQLGMLCPDDKAGRTYAEVIAAALARKAIRGDVRAAKEIALRTEGRPSKMPLKWDEDAE